MNIIWTSLTIICLCVLLVTNPNLAFNALIDGSEKAINLGIKLWAIYAVWLGILQIIEDTQLDKKIANLLNPLIKYLMGNQHPETNKQIAINITANFLGMGNACTPSGIKSINLLLKNKKKATNASIMFLILNTTSLQLLPTTVIGLRLLNNSTNATSIILPCFIATLCSTVIGIVLCKICSKFYKDEN